MITLPAVLDRRLVPDLGTVRGSKELPNGTKDAPQRGQTFPIELGVGVVEEIDRFSATLG